MREMLGEIDALKARWMIGGSAAGQGPQDWRGLDDLSMLALSGQFMRIATRPASVAAPKLRTELPRLSLPPMDDTLRPHFRRVLDDKTIAAADVVRLIAARGFCVNPVDWMPKGNEADLPAIYDPWRDWLEGSGVAPADMTLSAETWDDCPPHARYRDLTDLHRKDAEAARTLIAAIAPTLAADQRLRLLDCLRPGLTDDDADLLESFTGDRSAKVKALVRTQLARLGRDTGTDAEAAAEVTDFLSVARAGMLTRKKSVTARALKNEAQRRRRRDVLSRLSLGGLAAALELSADDVVEMWDFGDATEEIAEIAAATATDAQVERLTDRALDEVYLTPDVLIDRLSSERRAEFGLKALAGDTWTLAATRPWFPTPDGSIDLPALDASRALPELIDELTRADTTTPDRQIAEALSFLGLLVTGRAATALIDRLTSAGVLSADPRLALLRLNAAL